MTVAEYLKFAAELKKVPKNERETQIEQVMELTGITAMANRLIKNLSKRIQTAGRTCPGDPRLS